MRSFALLSSRRLAASCFFLSSVSMILYSNFHATLLSLSSPYSRKAANSGFSAIWRQVFRLSPSPVVPDGCDLPYKDYVRLPAALKVRVHLRRSGVIRLNFRGQIIFGELVLIQLLTEEGQIRLPEILSPSRPEWEPI